MKRCASAILGLLFSCNVASPLSAKAPTILIQIKAATLTGPIGITDPNFLNAFSFFNGPGVSTPDPGRYAPGTIIDWKSGAVSPPPTVGKRFEVSILTPPHDRPQCVTEQPCLVYVVYYDYDPVSKRGFVYLPGKGEPWHDLDINLLYHGPGVQGHWYRALDPWSAAVMPLIANATNRNSSR
jgi:hypothetical protein